MFIKRCPYCFSDQVYVMQNANTRLWQVQCIICMQHSKPVESKDLAIELWNKRIFTIRS